MENVEEIFLLQKLKEGDIKAMEVIFNRHYSDLCRYLVLLFKNQLLVENIAQDIFVYIWENRTTIEINKSIQSYLYTAGRYKALNEIRNTRRREVIRTEIVNSQNDSDVASDTALEIKELEELIENAISSLPDRCQHIFRLSREDDMSYKEIAKFLNLSINTVEGQMSIALKKMHKILRPYYLQIFLTV
jgi:RNA polymerase sigma-70 factor, ECF subfamily